MATTASRNDVAAYTAGSRLGAQVSDTQTVGREQSVTVDDGQPLALNYDATRSVSANVLASDLVPGECPERGRCMPELAAECAAATSGWLRWRHPIERHRQKRQQAWSSSKHGKPLVN